MIEAINNDTPTEHDEESPAVDITIPHQPQQERENSPQLEQQEGPSTILTTTAHGTKCIPLSLRIHVCSIGKSIYPGFIDLLMIVGVLLLSFLVYDVDICVVKGQDEDQFIQEQDVITGPSGRIVIRNGEQDLNGGPSIRTRMAGLNLV
jgi:hypothetical protein